MFDAGVGGDLVEDIFPGEAAISDRLFANERRHFGNAHELHEAVPHVKNRISQRIIQFFDRLGDNNPELSAQEHQQTRFEVGRFGLLSDDGALHDGRTVEQCVHALCVCADVHLGVGSLESLKGSGQDVGGLFGTDVVHDDLSSVVFEVLAEPRWAGIAFAWSSTLIIL